MSAPERKAAAPRRLWRLLFTPPRPGLRPHEPSISPLASSSADNLVAATQGTGRQHAELTRRLIEALYVSSSMSEYSAARLEYYTRWLIVLTVVLVVLAAATIGVAVTA